ncbi:hypothetical protein [Patulibacter americanus]|uniref:hypothetical protein n=1 Tax=Patulibacter americanus TaxID=588672 RepID=UPI0003B319D1|nr:hypothetical protein [Patulibacter americanus]
MNESQADHEAARRNRAVAGPGSWNAPEVYFVPTETADGEWTVVRHEEEPPGRVFRVAMAFLLGPWR